MLLTLVLKQTALKTMVVFHIGLWRLGVFIQFLNPEEKVAL